ncbi:COX assembly mitochondrial protein homolog [Paramacrobiotus metropolitanus]|uniref:COX assembly mitochondrial protein homolog n=1 Tax=Paramacrobiotus metropolitanus TaxID=2943436 RepID=UPI00244610D3|nr:COX assembly mitochondrial protein homolog [Paramacrobiotus metropolitanus]
MPRKSEEFASEFEQEFDRHRHVLQKGAGGPMGYGDPDDKTLRKVEKDVMVPMIIRDRTRLEKCREYYDAFRACGKAAGLGIVFRCRNENKDMVRCFNKWYHDPEFVEECTQEYLEKRAEFRKTGQMKKRRKFTEPAGEYVPYGTLPFQKKDGDEKT